MTAERTTLLSERDFLLRSLEDLEAERVAGEIDDRRYRELVDQYTARAANVLRALEATDADAEIRTSTGPAERRGRRWGVPAALAGVVLIAAALLPSTLGERSPGDTITGNAQPASIGPSTDDLADRARARPQDPDAHLAHARALLEDGELLEALKAFDRAAALDPTNAEALAYGGWIVLLAGLHDEAMQRIDRAVAAAPAYPDAHFFRAMALRAQGRVDEAVGELRTFLGLTPADAPMRDQVETLLAELEGSAGGADPSPPE